MARVTKMTKKVFSRIGTFLLLGLASIPPGVQADNGYDIKLRTYNATKHGIYKCNKPDRIFSGTLEPSQCLNISNSFNAFHYDGPHADRSEAAMSCKLNLYDKPDCLGDEYTVTYTGCFDLTKISSTTSSFPDHSSALLKCEETEGERVRHNLEIALVVTAVMLLVLAAGATTCTKKRWPRGQNEWLIGTMTHRRKHAITSTRPRANEADLPTRPERSYQPSEGYELASLASQHSRTDLFADPEKAYRAQSGRV